MNLIAQQNIFSGLQSNNKTTLKQNIKQNLFSKNDINKIENVFHKIDLHQVLELFNYT